MRVLLFLLHQELYYILQVLELRILTPKIDLLSR